MKNSRFSNYVTSMAFNLSLSKAMIVAMAQIANEAPKHCGDSFWAVGAPDTAVPAMRALELRGLVYAPDPKWPGAKQFTEAGQHVFELLKISGLITQLQTAVNDYQAAKAEAK